MQKNAKIVYCVCVVNNLGRILCCYMYVCTRKECVCEAFVALHGLWFFFSIITTRGFIQFMM